MSTETRDTIFIGKKPLMAYVTSTLIQLANVPSVNIKARGLSIGRAVDVAQIVARKTENAGYSIGNIKIDSESLESEDGRSLKKGYLFMLPFLTKEKQWRYKQIIDRKHSEEKLISDLKKTRNLFNEDAFDTDLQKLN